MVDSQEPLHFSRQGKKKKKTKPDQLTSSFLQTAKSLVQSLQTWREWYISISLTAKTPNLQSVKKRGREINKKGRGERRWKDLLPLTFLFRGNHQIVDRPTKALWGIQEMMTKTEGEGERGGQTCRSPCHSGILGAPNLMQLQCKRLLPRAVHTLICNVWFPPLPALPLPHSAKPTRKLRAYFVEPCKKCAGRGGEERVGGGDGFIWV